MKIYRNSKLFILIFLSIIMLKCNYEVTEFGFNGSIKGIVKDNSGGLLHGDLNSNNIVVNLLGDGEKQSIEIRLKGDGTYENIKIYPKKHKVWIVGPIVKSDTLSVDFSVESNIVKDFTVTPLISPKVINGTVNGTSINVEYIIVGNEGNSVKKMEIYCSTVQYPTVAIGSRENVYFTKIVPLTSLAGNITIDGLISGTKYFLRIGAQANTTALMNYSNQIELITSN